MQILGISSFDKSPIKELLTEPQVNQDVKEQYNLFSFKKLTHQHYFNMNF
jgi:hypothetical protein